MTENQNESRMEAAAKRLFYILATPRDQSVMPKPPVVVWTAAPGEGKSVYAKLVASALGISDDHYLRFNAGAMSDTDFHGLQWPTENGIRLEVDERIVKLMDGKPSIVALDEAGNMPRSTQACALGALDSGTMGRYTLPCTSAFLMMMNPPESGTDAQEIAFALANRANWQSFGGPTNREFAEFMSKRGKVALPVLPDITTVAKAYDITYATLTALHDAYLSNVACGGTLREDPTSDDVRARFSTLDINETGERIYQPSYCTPRSVTMGLNQAATALCYGDWPAAVDIMCGAFGRPQGMKFGAFAEKQDIVNPVALLKGEAMWTPDPHRPDRTHAQASACANVAISGALPGDPMKWWSACWNVFDLAMKAGAEKGLLTVGAERLAMNKPKGALLAQHADIIAELAPVVRATLA